MKTKLQIKKDIQKKYPNATVKIENKDHPSWKDYWIVSITDIKGKKYKEAIELIPKKA